MRTLLYFICFVFFIQGNTNAQESHRWFVGTDFLSYRTEIAPAEQSNKFIGNYSLHLGLRYDKWEIVAGINQSIRKYKKEDYDFVVNSPAAYGAATNINRKYVNLSFRRNLPKLSTENFQPQIYLNAVQDLSSRFALKNSRVKYVIGVSSKIELGIGLNFKVHENFQLRLSSGVSRFYKYFNKFNPNETLIIKQNSKKYTFTPLQNLSLVYLLPYKEILRIPKGKQIDEKLKYFIKSNLLSDRLEIAPAQQLNHFYANASIAFGVQKGLWSFSLGYTYSQRKFNPNTTYEFVERTSYGPVTRVKRQFATLSINRSVFNSYNKTIKTYLYLDIIEDISNQSTVTFGKDGTFETYSTRSILGISFGHNPFHNLQFRVSPGVSILYFIRHSDNSGREVQDLRDNSKTFSFSALQNISVYYYF